MLHDVFDTAVQNVAKSVDGVDFHILVLAEAGVAVVQATAQLNLKNVQQMDMIKMMPLVFHFYLQMVLTRNQDMMVME